MFGTLEQSEIEEVLRQQIVGRIGCHADGVTYIVPISYAFDGVYIYGHARDGMKITMMRKNPAVCFQVDEMKDMANWRSVVAWGEFKELSEKTDRSTALKALTRRNLPLVSSETTHLSPHWPFPAADLDMITDIVFRIRLTKKTGRFENNIVTYYNS